MFDYNSILVITAWIFVVSLAYLYFNYKHHKQKKENRTSKYYRDKTGHHDL